MQVQTLQGQVSQHKAMKAKMLGVMETILQGEETPSSNLQPSLRGGAGASPCGGARPFGQQNSGPSGPGGGSFEKERVRSEARGRETSSSVLGLASGSVLGLVERSKGRSKIDRSPKGPVPKGAGSGVRTGPSKAPGVLQVIETPLHFFFALPAFPMGMAWYSSCLVPLACILPYSLNLTFPKRQNGLI